MKIIRCAGQVGYMVCNIRNIKEALVGDTFHLEKAIIEPFPGFKAPKPMVIKIKLLNIAIEIHWKF